jgi:hypothetical protein
MRKFKAIALSIAGVFVLAAVPVTFAGASQKTQSDQGEVATNAAAAPICSPRLSAANPARQDIFVSTTTPKTYTGLVWQDVDCTPTTFRLGFGQRALVVADFSAEADCNGTAPNNGQWCEARAMLNGIEGRPLGLEPDSFAFDSVAGGASNWQAHGMHRAWEVNCSQTNGCQYRFAIQTKMHDNTVTGMRLDEVAASIHVTIGNPAPL